MSISESLQIMQTALTVALKIAAPLLLLSMLVGVLISVLQAATQINEQTITFVPKLVLIAVVLLAAGGWMLQLLMDFTNNLFDLMIG